jgi:hypothetical protein
MDPSGSLRTENFLPLPEIEPRSSSLYSVTFPPAITDLLLYTLYTLQKYETILHFPAFDSENILFF